MVTVTACRPLLFIFGEDVHSKNLLLFNQPRRSGVIPLTREEYSKNAAPCVIAVASEDDCLKNKKTPASSAGGFGISNAEGSTSEYAPEQSELEPGSGKPNSLTDHVAYVTNA